MTGKTKLHTQALMLCSVVTLLAILFVSPLVGADSGNAEVSRLRNLQAFEMTPAQGARATEFIEPKRLLEWWMASKGSHNLDSNREDGIALESINLSIRLASNKTLRTIDQKRALLSDIDEKCAGQYQ